MPTTYSHYRFGCTVYNRLPEKEKRMISQYRDLYNIGLHGPDLLFYYRPLSSNPVSKRGTAMHHQTGREIFTQAGEYIRKEHDFRPLLAYTYGFLCHFVLDSMCHGYIAQKIAESGISHSEIEAEMDRALMVHDGHNPVKHCVTSHILPSQESAAVISRFFPELSEKQTLEAMRSMVFYLNVLTAPSHLKRGVLFTALTAAGKKEMCDLVINYQYNSDCLDSTETLVKLYQKAQPKAVEAITSYMDIIHGRGEFDSLFDLTFDPKPEEGIVLE